MFKLIPRIEQSSKNRFRLLDLPDAAQKIVINQLGLVDVVELTTISNAFKRAVDVVKYPVNLVECLIGEWYHTIKIIKGTETLVLEAYCDKGEHRNGWYYELRKIDGEQRTMCKTELHDTFLVLVKVKEGESKMDVYNKICQHVLSFLAAQNYDARFYKSVNFRALSMWDFTKSLRNLNIRGLRDESLEIYREDLEFLLEQISSESIDFKIQVPGFKYQKPIRSEKIAIHDSSWIDFDAIQIHENSKSVIFYVDEIPSEGVNRLLRQWRSGGADGKLEDLVFKCPSGIDRDYTDLFKWLNASRSSIPEETINKRVCLYYSQQPPLEIQRSCDARLGTIIRRKRDIRFCVWPPRPAFPLLKLPHFPLKDIINQLYLKTVMDLTTRSSKFKRAVESARFEVNLFEFILGFSYNAIKIPNEEFRNELIMEAYTELPDNEYTWESAKLNGEIFPIASGLEYKVKTKNEGLKLEVLEVIATHLLSILNVKKFGIRCHKKYDFKNLFIWSLTKKINNFTIAPIDRSTIEITPEELKFLYEDVTIDTLDLQVKIPGYMHEGAILGKRIIIHDSSWINFDKFAIDSNTEYFCTKVKWPIPYSALSRLFQEWISGKNEKLENLQICTVSDWHRNDSRMFDGVVSVPTNIPRNLLKNRGLVHHYNCAACRPRDIKRVSDGRIATVVSSKSSIDLAVWMDKHYEKYEGEN